MTKIGRRTFLGGTASAVAALAASRAFAEDYPTRPIRLIVPYPPGGGTDTFARRVSVRMGEELGQQIVVDNRPGASTMIGADLVTHAPADGYMILLGDSSTYATNLSLFSKLTYDPQKSFAPVTLTARFPLVLVVHPSVPADTVAKFVALAKAKPGALNYGSPGIGSPHHLAMELFRQRAGIELTHVPYKGGAPAAQDLLAGHLEAMFLDYTTAGQYLKTGALRPLAVASPNRLAYVPGTPTVAESGYPGYEADAWQGFTVPAGTPAPIIARLNAVFHKVAADAAVQARMEEIGAVLTPSTPEQMASFMNSEVAKWAKTIRDGNIRIE